MNAKGTIKFKPGGRYTTIIVEHLTNHDWSFSPIPGSPGEYDVATATLQSTFDEHIEYIDIDSVETMDLVVDDNSGLYRLRIRNGVKTRYDAVDVFLHKDDAAELKGLVQMIKEQKADKGVFDALGFVVAHPGHFALLARAIRRGDFG